MIVVPVIDLMGGLVVRARMGARGSYRPIETPLSRTAEAADIIRGFLTLAPFKIFYIADLDAIFGRGNNVSVLVKIKHEFPQLTFWLDCGSKEECSVNFIEAFGEPILGSESQTSSSLLISKRNVLLSLDFSGEKFIGPSGLLEKPNLWPERVIVMTLARVGAGLGPDFQLIKVVRSLSISRQIFAAGGVRNSDDLVRLKSLSVTGVLVASALHDGSLRGKDCF